MRDIRVINRQNQLVNLLVKSESGAIETRPLLPRQSISLPAGSLSDQVFELNRRGHVTLAQSSEPKPAVKAPVVAQPVKATRRF